MSDWRGDWEGRGMGKRALSRANSFLASLIGPLRWTGVCGGGGGGSIVSIVSIVHDARSNQVLTHDGGHNSRAQQQSTKKTHLPVWLCNRITG